ncbi:general secretion pathway protein [Streptomyces cavourensis]|jgi:type II secretory ATPase GspE/PulE/Tfp pilus assembly ATPase PilB-like protein|uniref:ATPase, T2SS/T4P/T4SS family n=1 Tax=unclassified Achromobacter TaxID=2626865 RepID=UPI000E04C55F|nr:general secretion pathway protein [Streptomyces cavourensis]
MNSSSASSGALGAALCSLNAPEDIARLDPAFSRALGREFDLAAMAGRLCPVLFENGDVAIFAVKEFCVGDAIDEVERMVRAQGYRLAKPSRYLLPAALLLMVARGQLTAHGLSRRSGPRQAARTSALAALFLDIVGWGVGQGASDVHININQRREGCEVRYTIHGEYVVAERFAGLSNATLLEVLAVAWMDVRGGNGAVFDPALEQQGRIALELAGVPVVLRWASLATDAGPSVCLRILRLDATGGSDLRALGYLPGQVATLLGAREREGGAIVLAGVVGAGKSTTLAALMRGIAPTRKVITLEDPVEYVIGNALQNSLGGSLTASGWPAFDAKLKTIKRSALNDLLIGEIRDVDTGRAFMDLASSGISLYATTHAGSAAMIPERLASDAIGVSRELLAAPGILKLLVYQTLLPRLCPACAWPAAQLWGTAQRRHAPHEAEHWRVWMAALERTFLLDVAALKVRNPDGCAECRRPQMPELNGTIGRSVAAEMIEPEHAAGFLDCVRKRDYAPLRPPARPLPDASWRDEATRGAKALNSALFKAAQGEVDPRALLRRFDLGLCQAAAVAPETTHG